MHEIVPTKDEVQGAWSDHIVPFLVHGYRYSVMGEIPNLIDMHAEPGARLGVVLFADDELDGCEVYLEMFKSSASAKGLFQHLYIVDHSG